VLLDPAKCQFLIFQTEVPCTPLQKRLKIENQTLLCREFTPIAKDFAIGVNLYNEKIIGISCALTKTRTPDEAMKRKSTNLCGYRHI